MSRSRAVDSSQLGPHPRLADAVRRALDPAKVDRSPVPEHQAMAWKRVRAALDAWGGSFVLDGGCGTGQSTVALAELHPASLVIGIDKSADRLRKASERHMPPNAVLIRMDQVWFWRLAHREALRAEAQYLLYPNPWPKPGHLMRRWHAHPVLQDMLSLGGRFELRTNWRVYAEEMHEALRIAGLEATIRSIEPAAPITAFEAKYGASGHELWRVQAPQLWGSSSSDSPASS